MRCRGENGARHTGLSRSMSAPEPGTGQEFGKRMA